MTHQSLCLTALLILPTAASVHLALSMERELIESAKQSTAQVQDYNLTFLPTESAELPTAAFEVKEQAQELLAHPHIANHLVVTYNGSATQSNIASLFQRFEIEMDTLFEVESGEFISYLSFPVDHPESKILHAFIESGLFASVEMEYDYAATDAIVALND